MPLVRLVAVLLVVSAATVAALVLFIWWKQERIVFQPPSGPHSGVRDVERVTYNAEDEQPLFAFVIRPVSQRVVDSQSPSLTPDPHFLIAFHGNADLAERIVPWAKEVARRTDRVVILAEYRGYGLSLIHI